MNSLNMKMLYYEIFLNNISFNPNLIFLVMAGGDTPQAGLLSYKELFIIIRCNDLI